MTTSNTAEQSPGRRVPRSNWRRRRDLEAKYMEEMRHHFESAADEHPAGSQPRASAT